MTIAWLVVFVYAMTAIALGWRSRTDIGYWDASRSLSASSVGLSMSASFMSVSWTLVYATELYIQFGWHAAWLITVPWTLELWGIYLIVRKVHVLPRFSPAEMVAATLGKHAMRLVAGCIALVFIAWGGAELWIAASLLSPTLGISAEHVIMLLSLLVLSYAVRGGFGAVVATDRIQFALVLLMGGIFAVLALEFGAASGGEAGSWQTFLWPTGVSRPSIPLVVITLLTLLPAGVFQTDLWLRMQAAESVDAARQGTLITIVAGIVFTGLIPAVLALGVWQKVIAASSGTEVLVTYLNALDQPVVVALLVVGLLAAAMSTVDSCAHVVAVSLGYDLLGARAGSTIRNDGQHRLLGPLITTVTIGLMTVFALWADSLWDVFYVSGAVLTLGVVPAMLSIFWSGLREEAVVIASLGAISVMILRYSTQPFWGEPLWVTETGLAYIVWGMVAWICLYGLSRLVRKQFGEHRI